jgi:hypothetical protein
MINKTEPEKINTQKKLVGRSSKLKLIVEKDGNEVRYETPICGVYLMYIGDHFYCGRSVDIHRRAFQHQYDLGLLIRKYRQDQSAIPQIHYLKNVINHLISNPCISLLRVEIVEPCDKDQVEAAEQAWLSKSKVNPLNLNLGYVSKPSSGDNKKISSIKKNAQ